MERARDQRMKWKWDTDKIVSLSAMAVGVGSLVIILYQTKLMREQQRASVMPYLMMAVQSNKDTTYLTLRNAGIGPALLEDVRIRYRGKDFTQDPYDFFVEQRVEAAKTIPLGSDKLIRGRLVPPGEWIQTLGTEGRESGLALLRELLPLFVIAEVPHVWLVQAKADGPASEKAVIFITYSSVYGEKWHLRSDSFVPVPGAAPGAPQ
jgi:hypothetical protein